MLRQATRTLVTATVPRNSRLLHTRQNFPLRAQLHPTHPKLRQFYKRNESTSRGENSSRKSPTTPPETNPVSKNGEWSSLFPDLKTKYSSSSELLSSKTKEAYVHAKRKSQESVRNLELKSKDWLESTAKPMAWTALERTQQWSRQSWTKAQQVATSLAVRSRQWLVQQAQQATHWAASTVKASLHSLTERVRSSVQNGIQSTVTKPLARMQDRVVLSMEKLAPGNVWNKFVWWSLAAIGVYGIATTVPKEIVRHQLSLSSGGRRGAEQQEE